MKSPRAARPLVRSLGLGAAILAGMVIYAYGFDVTQVDLEETRSVQRRESLVRIVRALARPDILAYDQEEITVQAPIWVPCPSPLPAPVPPPQTGPYLVISPSCAGPGETIHVEGFRFPPNTSGPLSFIPPSGVSLPFSSIATDSAGHFEAEGELPDRTDPDAQNLRAVSRRNVGPPRLTQSAKDTWDKIIETVFLALLATTLGTLLAVPVSFLGARNIMQPVKSSVVAIALGVLAVPVGLILGSQAAEWARLLGDALGPSLAFRLVVTLALPLGLYFAARWALPAEDEEEPSLPQKIVRTILLLAVGFLTLLFLYLISGLALRASESLAPRLGAFGFLASFFGNLAEILSLLIQVLAALGMAGFLAGAAARLGGSLMPRLSDPLRAIVRAALAGLAGAVLLILLAAGIDWLYQLQDPFWTRGLPAVAGAALGLAVAIRTRRSDEVPIGNALYYVTRTVLNTLRSIEALIMVVVFVVWVGIGPFAGVLALSLHTIASLAKLYSEQVESIQPGPIEAVTATGATRLQTIVYAVIPQIVPPYISFTMYRWDINVRMSTIIGFAGGGGIGFLLLQNINLLNYRAASVQMLAITLVVASMDYLSSRLREQAI